ncbi:MAG: hypothetical protein IPG54_13640 [Sphingomonadales bacterium]|nr:hypothetical protein [Sphingomonadales bacterium]
MNSEEREKGETALHHAECNPFFGRFPGISGHCQYRRQVPARICPCAGRAFHAARDDRIFLHADFDENNLGPAGHSVTGYAALLETG